MQSRLPEDKKDLFWETAFWSFFDRRLWSEMEKITPRSDRSPVWSPDGRSIAFIRGCTSDHKPVELYLMDANSGRQRKILESADIQSVQWSHDGKLLVTQMSRLGGRYETDDETNNTPGYPEIWLVEIR